MFGEPIKIPLYQFWSGLLIDVEVICCSLKSVHKKIKTIYLWNLVQTLQRALIWNCCITTLMFNMIGQWINLSCNRGLTNKSNWSGSVSILLTVFRSWSHLIIIIFVGVNVIITGLANHLITINIIFSANFTHLTKSRIESNVADI